MESTSTATFSQVRYFKKRVYEGIQWEDVFKGSLVKCEKCHNSIRACVLQENANANSKRSKGNESCHSPVDSYTSWSVQIGIEAKKLANDPTWRCDHSPDETYFVRAICRGVKNLLKNSKP